MKFDLLFLTRNRGAVVRRCLNTLTATMSVRPDVTVRILDNASRDPLVFRAIRNFQEGDVRRVFLTKSALNLGVAGGRQVLLNMAQGDAAVFLDSDVIFPRNDSWLMRIERALQDSGVGVVGVDGIKVLPGWKDFSHSDKVGDYDAVSGFCQGFRLDLRRQGVRLNTAYNPFWCEDLDFCFQARQLGYRILGLGNIGIVHDWGKGGNNSLEDKKRYLIRQWRGKKVVECER